MAFDALELKGWAQVLNPPNSQLGQIAAAKQRQQQVNADQALKQKQADEKWWNDNVKLGFDDVRNELQQHEAELFKATHQEMVNTQKEILTGRMNQNEGRTKILQLQNNYDANRQLISSFNKNVDDLTEAYKAQKDLYDNAYVSSKVKQLMTDAYRREPDGSLTFNKEAVLGLQDVLSDPKAINLATLGKQYAGKLGMIENQYLEDYGDSWVDKTTKVSPLFQTEEKTVNGKKILTIKKDPNTGLPLANNSPEAIREWDSQGEIYSKKLDDLAQTDGITRAEAFAKYIAPFGKAEEEVAKSGYKPGYYGSGSNKRDYEYEITHGISNSIKSRKDVGEDGLSGKTSVSLMLPGFYDKPYTFKGTQNEDVKGVFNGLYRDSDGKESIVIEKVDSFTGNPTGQTETVPFTNLSAIRNTISDSRKRAEFDAEVKKFKEAKSENTAPDEEKLNSTVSNIVTALGEKSFWGGDNPKDVENIKSELVKQGVARELVDGLEIKVDRGGLISDHTITITPPSGEAQTFTIGDQESEDELKTFLHDTFQNTYTKRGAQAKEKTQTPQFDPTKF